MSLNSPIYEGRRLSIKVIVTAFVILIVILAVVYIHSSEVIPRLYIIPTKSMIPTLMPGDVVIIKHVNPGDIHIGDIIAYDIVTYNPGTGPYIRLPVVIVHRVINVKTIDGVRYFITKGDNNPTPDPWYVPESGVLGIAEKVLSLGKFGLLLLTPEGKIAMLLIVIFVVSLVVYFYEHLRGSRVLI